MPQSKRLAKLLDFLVIFPLSVFSKTFNFRWMTLQVVKPILAAHVFGFQPVMNGFNHIQFIPLLTFTKLRTIFAIA